MFRRYYKFNNGSTTTPNFANPGHGTNPAVLVNMTMGPGGQFDSALYGNGGTGTTTYLNSGWNMNTGTSSWTISLWINNFPAVTGTSYLFGNDITTSFRCFTNGAAGAGNITLRGTGITNVNVTGVLPGPSVVHFVYDATFFAVRTYVNGVFRNSISQAGINVKEVLTIANELKQPGEYTYEFNGTNLSSGVYFYKLEAGNFVDTKRMVLLK